MNLIELVGEKVSKKQIVAIATIVALLQIETTPIIKAVCITVIGVTAILTQAYLDKETRNENSNNSDVPTGS